MPNKRGGQNKRRVLRFLLNLIDWGTRGGETNGEFELSKNPLISVLNEKRDRCLILMLKLKISIKVT